MKSICISKGVKATFWLSIPSSNYSLGRMVISSELLSLEDPSDIKLSFRDCSFEASMMFDAFVISKIGQWVFADFIIFMKLLN